MSNRFDQNVGTTSPYTSTYAPMPLQALTQLAKDHSDRHRGALADINNTKGLLDIKADPRNEAFRNNYISQVNGKLGEMSEKIAKEGYTPENQSQWFQLKNAIVSDPTRLGLLQAHDDYYNKYQPDLVKANESGKYTDIYDPYKEQGNPNSFTPFNYKGMKTKQDYIPVMDKAIDGLKADSKAWEGYQKDNTGKPMVNEFGQLTKTNGEKETLTSDKLKQIAGTVAPTFFQSPESQYYIDQAFGKSMPSFSNLNNQQKEVLLHNATNDIIRRGSTQLFSHVKSGVDLQNLSEHALGQQDANLTTSSQSEALSNNIESPTKDYEFNPNGSLKPIKTPETIYKTSGSLYNDAPISKNQESQIDSKATQEATQTLNNIRNQHPELKDLNDKQVSEAYSKAIKSVSSESIPLESISNVAAKNIGEALSRNLEGRNMYILDSKGRTKTGTKDEVLKELGIKEYNEDKEKPGLVQQLEKGISGYTQAGPIAGAYYAEVKDGDGNNRRIMISPDKEMQETFKTSQAINEARKSLVPTAVTPMDNMPNYKIAIKPSIQKDGSTKWDYTEIITDNNGNIVKSNPTTLDDIRKSERDHLKKSGYLGSNLAVLKKNTTE